MYKPKYTADGATMPAFILEIFQLNGVLLAADNTLVSDLNMTSVKWRVIKEKNRQKILNQSHGLVVIWDLGFELYREL